MPTPRSLRLPQVLLATLAAVALVGCQGEVTEEDLQKWTHNDIGLARISEVVADPEQPLPTRIRALEVVVEKGFPTRIRGMLDDAGPARPQLVDGLAAELLDHLEKRDAAQFDAKDALILMQRYLTPDQFKLVQEAVAEWAFKDIDWTTSADEVKKKIEPRISSGQIADLGPWGWEPAGILVSHGFAVDKLLAYLAGANDPKATALLLKGVRKLHDEIGVRIHHVEALAGATSPAVAEYLLGIYMDKELDADIRTGAFNAAIAMMDAPGFREQDTSSVVKRLLTLMEGRNAEDRWLGAVNAVRLAGADRLEDVLAGFKDDGVYRTAEEDPLKSVMDLCLDVFDLGHKAKAVPVFMKHATDANPVVAAISVVCLKATQAHEAAPVLRSLVKDPADPTAVSLERFLGPEYTLGSLAQNALDGLALMKQVDDQRAAGTLDPTQAKNKKLIATFELKETGDAYLKLVAQRYAAFEAEYKANPAAFATP